MWYIIKYKAERDGYCLVQLSKTEFDTIVKYEDNAIAVTKLDYCGCTRINRDVAFKTKNEAITYLIKQGMIPDYNRINYPFDDDEDDEYNND